MDYSNFLLYKSKNQYQNKRKNIIDRTANSLKSLEVQKLESKRELNKKNGKTAKGGSKDEIDYLMDNGYEAQKNKIIEDQDTDLTDLANKQLESNMSLRKSNSNYQAFKSAFNFFMKV